MIYKPGFHEYILKCHIEIPDLKDNHVKYMWRVKKKIQLSKECKEANNTTTQQWN